MSNVAPNVQLADRIIAFCIARIEAVIERFLPDLRWPGFFAGYRVSANDSATLMKMLADLHRMGYGSICKKPIPAVIQALLRQIDGEMMETFQSFRVAETLLGFGNFHDNPLLADLSDAERSNIARAVDSSHIFDEWGKPLGGRPNNYWAVLARCEHGRQRLGLLEDDRILNETLAHVRRWLLGNPLGFYDDGPAGPGRYDIYSPDSLLFLQPLWEQLDQAGLDHVLRQHVRFFELAAMENGAWVAYGRSIGALSICMTMEFGALSLRLGLATDPGRMLGLIQHAFEQFRGWYADDLINAHRYKMTWGYRGPHRLLDMTLDCLSKMVYAAQELKAAAVTSVPKSAAELFCARDELFEFDPRGAGVWVYRNSKLAFQMPLIDGYSADYVPWFHSPGLLENPVDSSILSGVPRISDGITEFTTSGIPQRSHKTAHSLELEYGTFHRSWGKGERISFPGRRRVSYRIDQDVIHAHEHWMFDELPKAISFSITEARRPLVFEFSTTDLHHFGLIPVRGSQPFRSFWGELHRVHQIDFAPAKHIAFTYTLRPGD